LFRWRDESASPGKVHYALILRDTSGNQSDPVRAAVVVPPPKSLAHVSSQL